MPVSSSSDESGDFSTWVERHRVEDVIATLAALQLLPENDAHLPLLQSAIQIAASKRTDKCIEVASPDQLETILLESNELKVFREFGDPPEGLFTYNIPFVGGNYLIYQGGVADTGYFLRQMLKAAFQHPDGTFDKGFLAALYCPVRALLSLSDAMARKMGHSRWMGSVETASIDKFIPSSELLSKAKASVAFSSAELSDICEIAGIPLGSIEPFVVSLGDPRLSESSTRDLLFQKKPVLRIGESFIVAQPTSIAMAIQNLIRFAMGRSGNAERYAELYHKVVATNVLESIRFMHYEGVDSEVLPKPFLKDTCISEAVFRIDVDKLCFVHLLTDDLSTANTTGNSPYWNLAVAVGRVIERQEAITEKIKADNSANRLLFIAVIGGMGRNHIISMNGREADDSLILLLTAEELEVVSRLDRTDNLSLWKYANARQKANSYQPIISTTFIDGYSFYRQNHQSFYLENGGACVLLAHGQILRMKAAKRFDLHNIEYWKTESPIEAFIVHDENIPIYVLNVPLGESIEMAVEGYPHPIWIRPDEGIDLSIIGARYLVVQMNDLIAYWLWQVTPHLSADIGKCNGPVSVVFTIEDLAVWMNGTILAEDSTNAHEEEELCFIDVASRTIRLHLPLWLHDLFAGPDNRGERLVLSELIRGIRELADGIKPGHMPHTPLDSVIDSTAPLGIKKKLLSIHFNQHPDLFETPLPDVRLIGDHDIETALDGLAVAVNRKAGGKYPIGNVSENVNEYIDDILAHYESTIRDMVRLLDPMKALSRLVAQNEALIKKKAYLRLTGPTSAACFAGLKRKAVELTEDMAEIDKTALSLRFLLEFLVSEPPGGTGELTDELLDQLLGLAWHYTNFGMMGNHVEFGLFQHQLYVRTDGRVGIGDNSRGLFDEFLKAKGFETLEALSGAFKENWTTDNNPGENHLDESDVAQSVDEFKNAFRMEYGISVEDYGKFIAWLMSTAFSGGAAVVVMPHEAIIEDAASGAELHKNTIDALLEMLSLSSRGAWKTVPEGFKEEDILPNHYNRRLSFIRRPIARLENEYLWGPRHVHQAASNLIRMISNGRLKKEHIRSDEMKSYWGRVHKKRGDEFEARVGALFGSTGGYSVHGRTTICKGGGLECAEDLGDLDCVIVDDMRKTVYCPECKDLLLARNAIEMSREMGRFIRGKNNDVDKHLRRIKWVQDNWQAFAAKLGLSGGPWILVPFMLVSQEIPTKHLFNTTLPFLAYSEIKRDMRGALAGIETGGHVQGVVQ